MTVLCPASFLELHDMLRYAVCSLSGPVAVRYPRGGEGRYTDSNVQEETVLKSGEDVTIVCYGTMVNEALDAADLLEKEGIRAEIIKLGMACPNSFSLTLASARRTGKLIVPEEVCQAGCVGSALLMRAAETGCEIPRVRLLNLGQGIVAHGTVAELRHDWGIDAESIARAASELCGRETVLE